MDEHKKGPEGAALFIQKYGKEAYAAVLETIEKSGCSYPGGACGPEAALQFLESYQK